MPAAIRPPDEPDRINLVRSLDVLDTPPSMRFDRIVFIVAQLFHCPMATLSLVDEERCWFKARVGLVLSEIPRSFALCDHAIHADEPLTIENAETDSHSYDNPLVLGRPFIRFYAGAPLIGAGGLRVGALSVFDTRPRTPSARQLENLATLARSAMLELETSHGGAQTGLSAHPPIRGHTPIAA